MTAPAAAPPEHQAPPSAEAPPGAAGFWIDRLLLGLAARSPAAVEAIGRPAAALAWAASGEMRRVTVLNARRVLGPGASEADVRRLARRVVWRHLQFIAEMGRSERMGLVDFDAMIADVHGLEHHEAVRTGPARERGMIVATAHLGSFEVGVAGLRRTEDRVHVVFKRDPLPRFEAARQRCRRTLGVIEQPIDEGLPAWLAVRDALGRGEVVLMQVDRAMPGQRSVLVPFLGGHLEMPLGPLRLAAMTGAALVPIFAPRRDDGRVDVCIEPEIPVDPGDPEASAPALAAVVERYVRRYHDQWIRMQPACVEDVTPRQDQDPS